ncbi:hydroxyacid dehydrogenase [Microbacterium sp. ZW T5_45]|uniref:hydroxyacid dehydrogenase n=1 Tax=Microbacterium sp. ZW T5_45 TaxID=3378080 RepID=UPI003854C975
MKAALMMDAKTLPHVFGDAERRRLHELLEVDFSQVATSFDDLDSAALSEVEVLLTGWGVPRVDVRALGAMPALRAIIHWGGSVGFIDPAATARGVVVSSARDANAIPVAEYTVALLILAAKDAFWVSRQYSAEQRAIDREAELAHTGLYGTSIGIVGASSIGSRVMEMLRTFAVDVFLFDPFATAQRAEELGATLVTTMEELASRCRILSVHAPEIPATRGMVSRTVLAALPDGSTVVNTSRGTLIDQEALVDELRSGRLRAMLDVTDPDVLPVGHPLYTLPNVFLTPHLAGSTGSELRRLGQATVSEVARLVAGLPFAHPMAI